MAKVYAAIGDFVKERLERGESIHYSDIIRVFGVSISPAITYLRAWCAALGGEYAKGVCRPKQKGEG